MLVEVIVLHDSSMSSSASFPRSDRALVSKALVGRASVTRSLLSDAQAISFDSQTSHGLCGLCYRLAGYPQVSNTASDRD